MKLVPMLLVSALSLANNEPTWTFERYELAASLREPDLQESPLRLSCSQRGYLEINILSGGKPEVTLIGPSKLALTLRGDLSDTGRITSRVYFRSLTAEILRGEGVVDVAGARPYQLHLKGAREVLRTLESACQAVA